MRADFTVADYYSVNYYIQKQGFTHLTTVTLAKNGNFCFAFYKAEKTVLTCKRFKNAKYKMKSRSIKSSGIFL